MLIGTSVTPTTFETHFSAVDWPRALSLASGIEAPSMVSPMGAPAANALRMLAESAGEKGEDEGGGIVTD
jgi:hypothetical protein